MQLVATNICQDFLSFHDKSPYSVRMRENKGRRSGVVVANVFSVSDQKPDLPIQDLYDLKKK